MATGTSSKPSETAVKEFQETLEQLVSGLDFDARIDTYGELLGIEVTPRLRIRVRKFVKFGAHLQVDLESFQELVVTAFFSGLRELVCLLPRGNGKTTLFALIALYVLLWLPGQRIFFAASTREQAGEMFDALTELGAVDQKIAGRVKFLHLKARRLDKPGYIRVLSSDGGAQHGLRPTLVLVDELHAHKNIKLYVALKTAMGKVSTAQMVSISTAGDDEQATLGQLRQQAMKLLERGVGWKTRVDYLTIAGHDNGKFLLLEWACPADADLADVKVVKRANPASFVTEEYLQEQIDSPGLPDFEFAKFHCNVWAGSGEVWVKPTAWAACAEPGVEIPYSERVWMGIDVSQKHDYSALVKLWKRPAQDEESEEKVVAKKVATWKPVGDGTPLDLGLLEDAIRQEVLAHSAAGGKVDGVSFDPMFFQRSSDLLSDEGIVMVEFPQSNKRMCPASIALYEAINSGRLVHDGDEEFTAHVLAGITTNTSTGWRLTKNRRRKPIDLLMALAMAYSDLEEESTTSVYNDYDLLII